jgi:putative membrane protein
MIGTALVYLVALLHGWFFVLESFLWTTPTGRRVFGQSEADAATTRVLAANQGAYNGMLALGFVWANLVGNGGAEAFLLVFVVAMGLVGGVTVSPRIIAVQSLPALLALIARTLGV